MSAQNIKLQHN